MSTLSLSMEERALRHIDATDRDTWLRVGMALKSEHGEAAYDLWLDWSRTASNFEEAACRATWRSITSDGGVTLGTLFHLAEQNGFVRGDDRPYTPSSPEERAERERAAQAADRQAVAAKEARAYWDAARPAVDSHPYLQAKGVKAHGVRVDAEGFLLVPAFKNGGVSTLQRISPTGKKFYWPGAEKKGASFALTCGDESRHQAVVIVEGWATGAAVHESTGLPVIVAFDAANLLPVARSVRTAFPHATIICAADNDLHPDGKPNTGLNAATEAAKAVNGHVAVPEMNGQKCDWNDIFLAQGPEAVRRGIQAARPAHEKSEDTDSIRAPKTGGLPESNFNPITASELLAEEPEPVDFILDEYLAAGALVLIAGKPKEGKTTLTYEAAVRIAKGQPFLNRATKKCGVLILAVEESKRDIRLRLHNLGADTLDNLHLCIGPLSPTPSLLTTLNEFIKSKGIGLVVLDTLASFWRIKNENDASEMTQAVKPLLQLARDSGACVVAIHHARKSEGAYGDEIRGSGALFALVDVGLVMKRNEVENQRLLQAQSRYSETPRELVLELREGGYAALGDPASVGKEARLKKAMEALSPTWEESKVIQKRAGLSLRETNRLLGILVRNGAAVRHGNGVKGDPYRYRKNSIQAGSHPIGPESNCDQTGEEADSIQATPAPPCPNGNHSEPEEEIEDAC